MLTYISDILSGKKTYLSLIVLTITLLSGINVTEADITIVLNSIEAIVAAIATVAAAYSRAIARPKSK